MTDLTQLELFQNINIVGFLCFSTQELLSFETVLEHG